MRVGGDIVLLEIKCPFSRRGQHLVDMDEEVSFVPYLIFENGSVVLKHTHMYFTQAQVQLYILNLPKAIFFVYSSVGPVSVIVHRDAAFLSELIPSLEHFYFVYLLKALCR